MKRHTYLITGGSGFLGHNLCRYLLKKKDRVKSIDRVPFDYPSIKDKIKIYTGDIRNKKYLQKAMEKVDIVVHCAAALPLWKKEDIISINSGGTRNILEIAQKLKVKRVIYVSSTAVYGIPDHHPLIESDRLRGVGPYGKTKVEAEKICEEFKKKGMIIPILRPKSFLGPGRLGVFDILFDWVRRGKNIPLIGNGKNRYQLLDVEDLNDSIYLCATKPASIVNDTFNIGAKEFTTMKEDFGALLAYAGFGKKIIPIPSFLVLTPLRILEFFKLSPLYKWVYETAPQDSFVSIEKAEKKLGWKPKYSNKETLIRTYRWYASHYKKYENQTGVTHALPWKQGILKFFRMFF